MKLVTGMIVSLMAATVAAVPPDVLPTVPVFERSRSASFAKAYVGEVDEGDGVVHDSDWDRDDQPGPNGQFEYIILNLPKSETELVQASWTHDGLVNIASGKSSADCLITRSAFQMQHGVVADYSAAATAIAGYTVPTFSKVENGVSSQGDELFRVWQPEPNRDILVVQETQFEFSVDNHIESAQNDFNTEFITKLGPYKVEAKYSNPQEAWHITGSRRSSTGEIVQIDHWQEGSDLNWASTTFHKCGSGSYLYVKFGLNAADKISVPLGDLSWYDDMESEATSPGSPTDFDRDVHIVCLSTITSISYVPE